MSVAKLWDDLWLGVISLSNLVIAGFPRNIFKYSGREEMGEVSLTFALATPRLLDLRMPPFDRLVRLWRAKVQSQKGNSPDRPLRCLTASETKVLARGPRGGWLKSSHPLKIASQLTQGLTEGEKPCL